MGEKNGGRHGAPGEAPWIARYRKAQGEPSTKEGGKNRDIDPGQQRGWIFVLFFFPFLWTQQDNVLCCGTGSSWRTSSQFPRLRPKLQTNYWKTSAAD